MPDALAASCPAESDLKKSVARRLGRDPFVGPPAYVVTIVISAPDKPMPRLQAQLWWQDAVGKPNGSREIRQADRDCRVLMEAVAFAVSVKIQLASNKNEEPPDPPGNRLRETSSAERQATHEMTPASPASAPKRDGAPKAAGEAALGSVPAPAPAEKPAAAAPTAVGTKGVPASTANRPAPPPPTTTAPAPAPVLATLALPPPAHDAGDEQSPRMRWSAGGGIFGAAGVLPGLGWGARALGAVADAHHLSLEVALEATLPSSRTLVDGTGFAASTYGVTVTPCATAAPGPRRHGGVAGCLVLGTGVLRAHGDGLDLPRTATGWTWSIGARLETRVETDRRLWVGAHLDLRLAPAPWSVSVNDTVVWKSPLLMLLVGVDVGAVSK